MHGHGARRYPGCFTLPTFLQGIAAGALLLPASLGAQVGPARVDSLIHAMTLE